MECVSAAGAQALVVPLLAFAEYQAWEERRGTGGSADVNLQAFLPALQAQVCCWLLARAKEHLKNASHAVRRGAG